MVSIGIHINQDRVCFAELSLERAKPKLNSFSEYFFGDQKSQKEKLLFISHHLEKIKEKHKGKALRFCYGLSQNLVTNFLVQFPFKEKFKILKTLPFEIENKSPFNPEKIFFDARICKIKDENKSSALCFVTLQENVDEFLELSTQLKVPPYLLSCEGSALANLLELWNKPLSQTQNSMSHSLYIYLGAQNSQILFYKEGYLAHISVLDWSVTDIVKKMEQMYRLTAEQAWEEFFAKSFILTEVKGFTKEQVFFSNLIKKQLSLLIPDLKLLKMSLETEQQMNIKEAVVFGPGSVIKNLTAFLTTEISINISRLKSLTDFPYFQWGDKPSVLIAFGLALEGLKSSPYQGLNFLQSMKKEDFSLFPKKWQKTGLIFLSCFIIFIAYAFIRKQESFKILSKMESLFIDYGKRIAFLQESNISVESLKSFLEKEKLKANNEQLLRDKLSLPNPMDHLRSLTQKLDETDKWNLKIHYLKVEDGAVEIKGSVNKSSLNDFKSQLESLAKGRIKETPYQKNRDLSQPENHNLPKVKGTKESQASTTEEKAQDSKSAIMREKPVQDTSSGKKQPGLSGKILESSEPKTDLEQEEQSFYSYSFKMKEGF